MDVADGSREGVELPQLRCPLSVPGTEGALLRAKPVPARTTSQPRPAIVARRRAVWGVHKNRAPKGHQRGAESAPSVLVITSRRLITACYQKKLGQFDGDTVQEPDRTAARVPCNSPRPMPSGRKAEC
jgi:hypothetical protein